MLTKNYGPIESMFCPECSAPLELESLTYTWHQENMEANVTYLCPKCKLTFDKEGNRLRRNLTVEELGL
jgi:hypothetical protein